MSRRAARRSLLLPLGLLLAAGLLGLGLRPGPPPQDPGRLLAAVLDETDLPGGVVAWGRPGAEPNIVALGLADRATGREMTPEDRFRLASLTKPVTAAAVLRLVDAGRLDLDAPFVARFPELSDPRLATATIRHLLRHEAGWDRVATGGDPYFRTAAEAGLAEPVAGCRPVAAAAAATQFSPGARHAYSNTGYCWLGEIIAAETGRPYGAALAELLGDAAAALTLDPGAITVRHETTAAERALLVTRPEVIGPAGGLVSDAAGFLRFALAVDDPRIAAPAPSQAAGDNFYGLGWRVWRRPEGQFLSHYGAMPGSFALALRRVGGGGVVMLFNGALADPAAAAEILIARLIALPGWQ